MRPLQRLTLEAMMDMLSPRFAPIPDIRQADRVDYSRHDTLMSGFAMLFFPHASLVEFQRQMHHRRGRCHLATIFAVHEVPSDPQMRAILDGVPLAWLRQVVPALLAKVRRAGWAQDLKSPVPRGFHHGDDSSAMLEGSDDCHATKVQCPGCLQRTESTGQVHDHHTGVSAPLVQAGSPRGMPLDVAEGHTSDGPATQDCALHAAKRLLSRLRQEPPQLPRMIGGDALSGPAPFIAQWREWRLPQVCGCQPLSPLALYAWVEDMERLGGCEQGQWHAGPACRRHVFPSRIARSVPLTAARRVGGPLREGWEHDRKGQPLSHHAWCTDVEVTADKVAASVRLGRSRWKMEHEQCNGQNNHGYELEPNDGHGQQPLSMGFDRLNLLACIAPMGLERGDRL